jgi:hypothetical protein
MLACSHDLCLNCAADRLAFEMKKNKTTNVWKYLDEGYCLSIMSWKNLIRFLKY